MAFDPDGKTHAGTTHLLGNNLYYRLVVVGFDRSQQKLDVTMTVQCYDEKGKVLLSEPITVSAKSEDAKVVAASGNVNFNGSFLCNRPGLFRLRIVVVDNLTNRSTSFEAPLKITE